MSDPVTSLYSAVQRALKGCGVEVDVGRLRPYSEQDLSAGPRVHVAAPSFANENDGTASGKSQRSAARRIGGRGVNVYGEEIVTLTLSVEIHIGSRSANSTAAEKLSWDIRTRLYRDPELQRYRLIGRSSATRFADFTDTEYVVRVDDYELQFRWTPEEPSEAQVI